MDVPSKFEIKAARERAGLTQTEAAALVSRSKPTWQRWESGKTPMDPIRWGVFLTKTKIARRRSGV